MTDTTPEQILARAQVPSANGRPDPQGRDRAPRARALHRVVAARAALAPQAAAVRPRRAGRLVGLGALPRLLRVARLGRPRPQPAEPLLVADRRSGRAVVRDRTSRTSSAALERLGPTTVVDRPRDGRAARAQGRRAACRSAGSSSSRPELPRALREPAPPHELRDVPEVYGRSLIGWATLPEKLQRDDRDLTIADVLRDPAPARPEAARERARPPADARRRAGRPRPFAEIPRLVIGGGLDRIGPEPDGRAAGRVARRRVRAVRRALALRARRSASRATSRSPTRSAAFLEAHRLLTMPAVSPVDGDDRGPLVSSRSGRGHRSAAAVGAAFV